MNICMVLTVGLHNFCTLFCIYNMYINNNDEYIVHYKYSDPGVYGS